LCRLDDGSLAAVVASYKPKDDQRRFQFEVARIALAEGVGRSDEAMAADRHRQSSAASCCRKSGPEWGDEWQVEIAIAGLEEPDDKVRGYAVVLAKHAAQRGISADQRARITQRLVRAMSHHDEHPKRLFWLEYYVELLGLTANASDQAVIERLERLRPFAGVSRRTVTEKLDPDNLPLPHPKHDWPAGLPKPVVRVWDVGTGLLEIKSLESALKQIRARR
jgi:hypothetical protein